MLTSYEKVKLRSRAYTQACAQLGRNHRDLYLAYIRSHAWSDSDYPQKRQAKTLRYLRFKFPIEFDQLYHQNLRDAGLE